MFKARALDRQQVKGTHAFKRHAHKHTEQHSTCKYTYKKHKA